MVDGALRCSFERRKFDFFFIHSEALGMCIGFAVPFPSLYTFIFVLYLYSVTVSVKDLNSIL